MAEKQYLEQLSPDDRLRYRIITEKGAVVRFTVQYEAYIGGRWHPIVRYDTAHGFAHRDLLHPDGTQEKTALSVIDFKQALSYAKSDLKAHWEDYKKAFLEEMEEQ